jgi:ferredoxin
MALLINETCVACDACEPVCPNKAITAGSPIYVIDPDKCTECVGADLRGANLSGADLFAANLRDAMLSSANLTGAQGNAGATRRVVNCITPIWEDTAVLFRRDTPRVPPSRGARASAFRKAACGPRWGGDV